MPVLALEQEARQQIDEMLKAAGWEVQSYQRMNRSGAPGVAVCEFPLSTGWVDYMLFADGRPIGVVEAKAVGMPLSGVEPQAMDYCAGLPEGLRPLAWGDPLPFRYASTGVETFFADDRDPNAATKTLWIYDLRTNMNFTLKQNPLTREDLDEFVACYNPENRHERTATWSEENPDGRWRAFGYDELMARDKVNLDIFWLRDESLEETANLPEPDVLAVEIVEDLEAALEQFRLIAEDLGE